MLDDGEEQVQRLRLSLCSAFLLPSSWVGKQWQVGPWPGFVNKVLLEHRHAHLFTNGLQSLSYLLSGSLQKKLAVPWPGRVLGPQQLILKPSMDLHPFS